MILKQEDRHRGKQSTIQRYEFHYTSIQRTSSVTYFAVRKTTQHELPQLKPGPTIYAIGPPVISPPFVQVHRFTKKSVALNLTLLRPIRYVTDCL